MKTIYELINELSHRDTKSLSQKTLKLMEEAGELAKAVLPYEGASGCNHRVPNLQKVTEEVADVLLVAYSIACSLGVSDSEILKMVTRKAHYWKKLADAEEQVDLEKLAFEVHITVDSIKSIDQFREDCTYLGVKPIILDLYTSDGVIEDVMTSSQIVGSTSQAVAKTHELTARLRLMGYNVVREKIETVPWHPASQNAHVKPSLEKYFEAHLAFPANSNDNELFEDFLRRHRIRLSRNLMKAGDQSVQMGTYRRSSMEMSADLFQEQLIRIVEDAQESSIQIVKKPITEYALFDTSVDHDKAWFT